MRLGYHHPRDYPADDVINHILTPSEHRRVGDSGLVGGHAAVGGVVHRRLLRGAARGAACARHPVRHRQGHGHEVGHCSCRRDCNCCKRTTDAIVWSLCLSIVSLVVSVHVATLTTCCRWFEGQRAECGGGAGADSAADGARQGRTAGLAHIAHNAVGRGSQRQRHQVSSGGAYITQECDHKFIFHRAITYFQFPIKSHMKPTTWNQ